MEVPIRIGPDDRFTPVREIAMATIIYNIVFGPAYLVADLTKEEMEVLMTVILLVCMWWLVRYAYSLRWERRAREVIHDLDRFDDNLGEIVHEVRELYGVGEADVVAGRPVRLLRYRAHRAREMVIALADKAYFQFGHREVSDANKLITRKYMRDILVELKDLRIKDANIIIDGALLLSFLPSAELRRMTEISRTRTYGRRADMNRVGSWWWWAFGSPSSGDH